MVLDILTGAVTGYNKGRQENFQNSILRRRQQLSEDREERALENQMYERRRQEKMDEELREMRQFQTRIQVFNALPASRKPEYFKKQLAPTLNSWQLGRSDGNPELVPSAPTEDGLLKDWIPPMQEATREIGKILKMVDQKLITPDQARFEMGAIIKRTNTKPENFPKYQEFLQGQAIQISDIANYLKMNLTVDNLDAPEFRDRITRLNRTPEGREELGKIMEAIKKKKEDEDVRKERQRLDREKEERTQARIETRADEANQSRLKAAKIAAGATKDKTTSSAIEKARAPVNNLRSEFTKNNVPAVRGMIRDGKKLKALMKKNPAIIGATGWVKRLASSVEAQAGMVKSWITGEKFVPPKGAEDAYQALSLATNIAYNIIREKDPRISEQDFKNGMLIAISNSQNPADIERLLDWLMYSRITGLKASADDIMALEQSNLDTVKEERGLKESLKARRLFPKSLERYLPKERPTLPDAFKGIIPNDMQREGGAAATPQQRYPGYQHPFSAPTGVMDFPQQPHEMQGVAEVPTHVPSEHMGTLTKRAAAPAEASFMAASPMSAPDPQAMGEYQQGVAPVVSAPAPPAPSAASTQEINAQRLWEYKYKNMTTAQIEALPDEEFNLAYQLRMRFGR